MRRIRGGVSLDAYRLPIYNKPVIRSFRDAETERIFHQQLSKRFGAIEKTELIQLQRALSLRDLAAIPGNQLEPLRGDRTGQYSIRINDQYRICFRCEEGDACDVEITDYH
jgi:toxin HigB-1